MPQDAPEPHSQPTPAPSAAGRREAAVAGVAVFGWLGAMAAARPAVVTRPFWYDELLVRTLAADPSLRRAMSALAAGVDNNPPGLHLLTRMLVTLAGDGEVALRLWTLAWAGLALWLTYLAVRRLGGPGPAACGTALVAAYPLFVEQAVTLRFYAPWLAASAGLVWSTAWLTRPGIVGKVAFAGFAALATSLHWLGIVGVFLLCCGVPALQRAAHVSKRSGRSSTRPDRLLTCAARSGILPMLAAPAMLLVCLPILLAQRADRGSVTWLVNDAGYATRFRDGLFPTTPLAIVACGVVLTLAWNLRRRRTIMPARPGSDPATVGAAVGLLLVAPAVVALSFTLQPMLMDRYAIPFLIGIAGLTTLCLRRTPWPLAAATVAALLGASQSSWSSTADAARGHERGLAIRAERVVAALEEADLPVVFTSHTGAVETLYALGRDGRYGTRFFPRAAWPAIGTLDHRLNVASFDRLPRREGNDVHMQTAWSKIYPSPALIDPRDLDAFWLFPASPHRRWRAMPVMADFASDRRVETLFLVEQVVTP